MRLSVPLLLTVLGALPASAAPVALVKAATTGKVKKLEKASAPPATLIALNTHETFTLKPDGKGRFDAKTRKAFASFLRCHHTGRKHAMAPRLLELLYATARHFDYHRVLIVAGYRAPKVARKKGNPRSPHKQGAACDFRVEGVANTTLRDFVRDKFARVGVGYYPNSGFVHLDVRDKNAFWIDESGPGERARYVKGADEAIAVERAFGLSGPSPREEQFDREALPDPPQLGSPQPGEPTVALPKAPPIDEPAAPSTDKIAPSSKEPWGNSPQALPAEPTDPGGAPPPVPPSGS